MSLTRRGVLAGGGAAVLALGVLGRAPRAAPVRGTPFAVPEGQEVDLVEHVLCRCSFGAAPGERERLRALGPRTEDAVDRWIDHQLQPSGEEEPELRRSLGRLESLAQPLGELYEWKPEVLLRELSSAALLRAVGSRWQLREVMVDLWSDHLNIDASKGECAWLKAADDREVIRRHALGRFRDLIGASALSPAMLWYLDGRTNRRATTSERPNENYARELLELHTLGVDGGYTQADVMEAARCLTGWMVRDRHRFRKGRVEFDPALHDDAEKRVLGHRIATRGGPRDLEALLDIVARHPATARHVAVKLCRRLIADTPPADAVETVAAAFRGSDGDLRVTLRTLLRTEAFRSPAARRAKLKRPFQAMASALRATGARTDGGPPLLELLKRMGQAPFQYPTPEGAPDVAPAWTGTLLWRWQLAMALAGGELAGTSLDVPGLVARAGGVDRLAAHLLGRAPTRSSGPRSPRARSRWRCSSPPPRSRGADPMSAIGLGNTPDEDRVLVTVFLRGGADGLTLVPPVGDDGYHRARPRLGVPPSRALRLDGPFELAPELAELHPWFLSGQLAVVHAVGSDDDSRSHFVAQELMERGGVAASGGWLGRWLRARGAMGALTAVSTGPEVPDSLRGAPSATALAGLMKLAPGREWSALCESLGGLYARDAQLGGPARDALAAAERVSRLRTEGVRPEHGARYAEPREGEVAHAFGQQLAQVAGLIRARIGLVAACVDLAGWDSHFAQETIVTPRLRALALGLSAFATDLGPALSRVTVVVMSEFGRRVAENASLGTDHGRGGVMLVLGGGTPGGMHCRWPGLDADRLEGPGDLPVVHDYRDVLAAVLARHGAVPPSVVFPGHVPRPLAV